jgi:hypothetical protein
MLIKLLVAGALGAGLLYIASQSVFAGVFAPGCDSCGSNTGALLLTGATVGAGVQLGVMLLGVS